MTSDSWRANVPAAMPCIPGMPIQSGLLEGNPPSPMRVVTTGICETSAMRVSASEAPEWMTPPPA
jgi:hypothetical protein